MQTERHVRLFKNGRNQALRIPRDSELPGDEAICTSLMAGAELRFGALKKGSQRLLSQLEAVLSAVDTLPPEVPVDVQYARLRLAPERTGTPTGGNDMLIAAHALAPDLTLVSNARELSRVPGLTVENWLTA